MNANKTFQAFLSVLAFTPGILLAQSSQQKFVEDKPFIHIPRSSNTASFSTHPPNRTIDGTNNNITTSKKLHGACDISLRREMPAQYGAADPKNEMNGTTRPSARQISNLVCDEPVTQFNSRDLSAFVYVWGQFIDHDMTLTPTSNTEYYPVQLPNDEPLFTVPIPFFRSEIAPGSGVTNDRQQRNLNTAWIDASTVYGSEITRANWLRTFVNGKLKTSTGNFMPWNTLNLEQSGVIDPNAPSMANDANHTVKTFVAGDVRAAEHPGIAALHTVFVREHNRVCDDLISQGWTNDELIYQRARKYVNGLIQAITYQEWLPAVGVSLSPYNNYSANCQPDISNIFATAGFRIGHTMVADDILLRDNDCEPVEPDEFDLIDVFWQPDMIIVHGMEPFLKGFATHTQYETDLKVNDILRNFLFGSPTATVRAGMDLPSLNIQRGRDHGLPPYVAVRAFFTGQTITSFSQITTNTTLATQLQTLYGTVGNIDLWVGLLAEDRLPNKSVGTTMHAILKTQFESLRDGDYYWFKSDPFMPSNIRNVIRQTSFADVLERNTDLVGLQGNLFFAKTCPGDTLEEERVADVAMNSYGTADIKVFPNPVKDILNLEFENVDETININLISPQGALVKSFTKVPGSAKADIDMASFSPGVYIVNLQSATKNKIVRIIKVE